MPDDAYKTLENELDKTAVISVEFKRFILGWVLQLTSEAYERGRRAGLEETYERYPEGFVLCKQHGIGHHEKYPCFLCKVDGENHPQLTPQEYERLDECD